jgi:Zn-dependent alcohol dehydrogenase
MGCSFLFILPYFSLVSHLFDMTITAFSSSPDKETEAKELGATHFINSRDPEALQSVQNYPKCRLEGSRFYLGDERFRQYRTAKHD